MSDRPTNPPTEEVPSPSGLLQSKPQAESPDAATNGHPADPVGAGSPRNVSSDGQALRRETGAQSEADGKKGPKGRSEQTKPSEVRAASFVLKDRILEQVVRGNETSLVEWRSDGSHSRCSWYDNPETGKRLMPLTFQELAWARVVLPSEPKPYGSTEELDERLLAHIRKYTRVPAHVEPILPLFIRASWLIERSRTAPYLRLTGLPGSGKSRTSKVIGHLCMKPYVTNGSTTEASLFRNMDKLGVCTIVLDEAEHDKDNSAKKAIIALLKVGFEHDGEVERANESQDPADKGFRVDRFKAFGPKIIAAIKHDPDEALKTRCIPIHMIEDPNAVVELPLEYETEIRELQNRLLQWRLDHFFTDLPEPKRLRVKPRLLQLYLPMAKGAFNPKLLRALDDLILDMNEEMTRDMKKGLYHRIAERLLDWMTAHPEEGPIFYTELADTSGALTTEPITVWHIGEFVKAIGLDNRKPRGKGRCVASPYAEIRRQLVTYGLLREDEPAEAA